MGSAFEIGTTINERISRFLEECKDAGIEWRRAAIVAAAAYLESGEWFRITRSYGLVYPRGNDDDCRPVRAPLALERGNPHFGTDFTTTWTNDTELMELLRTKGWLDSSGRRLTSQATSTDSGDKPNEALAYIFEWLMDKRKARAIASFSIGATQCYLLFGMISKPEGYAGIPGRASSWQNLYDFYFARTVTEQFESGMWDYLSITSPSYPVPGSPVCGAAGTVGCIETYLQTYQTGTVDWSTDHFAAYARQFGNAVNTTWALGASVGYPNRK